MDAEQYIASFSPSRVSSSSLGRVPFAAHTVINCRKAEGRAETGKVTFIFHYL
jgi:hypothetical protein